MNGNQSEDENDTERLLKQKSSQHKNKTSTSDKSKSSSSNHKSSKKDNSFKEIVEKSKEMIHKSKDVINKSKDVIKSKDIVDKSKDVVNKLKDVSKSKEIVDKSKDIVSKPKDMVDKPKDIVEKSKDNVNNKPKDIVDKSKEKSFLSKYSHSNSSSHKSNRTDTKRTKRSLEEKKKSSSLCKEPKLLNGNRSDDESNSGGSSKHKSSTHKNKSSSSDKSKSSSSNHKSSKRDNSTDVVDKSKDKSLSKNSSITDTVNKSKDKSLSKITDRTIDKSKDKYFSKHLSSTDVDKSKDKYLSKNSTSSRMDKSKKRSLSKNSSYIDIVDKSKNKSSSKNSSSTDVTDKSKIKSSLIKDARCADAIEKFKDKSMSKNSSSSSHKSNRTDTKRLKLSQEEKNESPTNKVIDEEKKPEESEKSDWNDFRSSIMTNDEQDAANVLLSMSAISYESSHSEIITENIIFIETSSSITDSTTVNELEVDENSDQTKILLSNDNNDIKDNSQLKSNNLEKSQSPNVVKSSSNINQLFEKVCSVDIEILPCNDIKLQCSSVNNFEITEEHEKPAEIVVDEKELKILNVENNLKTIENEKSSECNSNDVLKVPKLKLKLLPNQIDSINKIKRKKHHQHKDSKKLKPSKSLDVLDEVSVSKNMCDKIDQQTNYDINIIINDPSSTLSNQILHEGIEKKNAKLLDDDKSLNTFKGFSEADAIPCKSYILLKNVIKTLQAQMNNHDKIDDGFKGFTSAKTNPCKHRDDVYAELIKLEGSKSSTGFIGFSERDTVVNIGYKYVVKQLELAKKQNNVDSHQQNVKCGENGIQNGKILNEVMATYLNKSNDEKSKENYSEPINDTNEDSPTVNNNNHNHDNWEVEQEMKYRLLPVKVRLERLMEYRCSSE